MMTPEEAKVYNRCAYLEMIQCEMEFGVAEECLEKGTKKGYWNDEDVATITEYINARNKLSKLASDNRRYDFDW